MLLCCLEAVRAAERPAQRREHARVFGMAKKAIRRLWGLLWPPVGRFCCSACGFAIRCVKTGDQQGLSPLRPKTGEKAHAFEACAFEQNSRQCAFKQASSSKV